MPYSGSRGYLFGKIYGPHDEIYRFEDGSDVIIYYDINGITTKILIERIVEISKKYIESTESQEVIKTITNFDDPIIEIADYDNKTAWRVSFTTTHDGIWGPISIYIDGYTGDVIGMDLLV